MKEFIINRNDSGQRLDKFVLKAVPRLPQSMMYKAIRNKRIKINGKRAEISSRLCEGDTVQMYLNDEFFDSVTETEFMSVSSVLNIIYEDENIMLLDKKNGMVVHEDDDNTADTLINRVKRYLYDKGEYDPNAENSFAPALCNRLDRNTGGIVIAAKNAESLRILNQKIRDREIEKYYLCITAGVPSKRADTVTAYLEKDSASNTVKVTDRKSSTNKTIVTSYRVIRDNGSLALVEIKLGTGRTHQIRAHMAHIGCPLLGDGKYGINRINREYKVKTQALYSYRLKFAFSSESGCLEYLNGKEFRADKVWFEDMFL
ncbi:MAG: RluA family pseudouridine synthase [Oscillospiraceae bacterium]|nr:RluA family pseudouridine synthase [Oscillospiraceae bacterium]